MRDNEMSRVAAVLEHKASGDVPAMVVALAHLWSEPPEQVGELDLAAAEAWQAVVAAGAVGAAVQAGLALIRQRVQIRPHAFVDLTENVSTTILEELASFVLDAGWDVELYLAPIFIRFAEQQSDRSFWEVVEKHRDRFKSDPECWKIVTFILATSLIGEGAVVNRWFGEWKQHERVPMWLLSAWASTLGQSEASAYAGLLPVSTLRFLIDMARFACERLEWDDSAAFFVCLCLIGDLLDEQSDTFLERMEMHRDLLQREAAASLLDHPIVRYANRFKHKAKITKGQLDAPRAPVEIDGRMVIRPPNRQLVEVVIDLGDLIDSGTKVFSLFVELHETPPKNPRAVELMRKMAKSNPAGVRWVMPAWRKLVRQRVPWLTRFKFEYFG